jgi:xanthine dehydrogenase accessory factor
MRDVLPELQTWSKEGQLFAIATVVQTWGSAPRQAGSKMAVAADGRLAGSVSGGCVEAAVIEAAREVVSSRTPRLLHFGVADEEAWTVGLACGGAIDVFVDLPDPAWLGAVTRVVEHDETAALVTVVKGPTDLLGTKLLVKSDGTHEGSLGPLTDEAQAAAVTALAGGRSARVDMGDVQVFVEVVRPAPTLVVVGGVHIAIALTRLAQTLGYRTIVVDPRPVFGNEGRFPHADRVVATWPDEALDQIGLTSATAVAVLTHDPKLDDPALSRSLPSPAFYVGALGSKATQAKRRQRLLDAGLSEVQVGRLHAPIGLDLGGRSPEEIAMSVMAQVVAVRNGADRPREKASEPPARGPAQP